MTIKLFLGNSPIDNAPHSILRGSVFAAALCVALLGGCAAPEVTKTPVAVIAAPTPPTPIALTDAAESSLKAAEQSVIEARVRRALWTAAVEELDRARTAARGFDSNATVRHAREVIALCDLSIAQLSKAPVKWQ